MKKLMISTLALVFAVAPAIAQDGPEKEFKLKLFEQFQMVGNLGKDSEKKRGSTVDKTKTPGDVYFQNRRFRAGFEGKYGILEIAFGIASDKDTGIGGSPFGLDTASATLAFMDEVQLSLGGVATTKKGCSSSATLGTECFLVGKAPMKGTNMGIKLHGKVAGGLFEYAFSVYNGYQDFNGKSVKGVEAPGVALQLRFNLLGGETTGNSEYFLGKKSAMTLGFTVAYQALPNRHKFYKFNKTKTPTTTDPSENHALHFDVFLTGDVALGDNSLPFLLIYEHVGMNPAVNEQRKAAGYMVDTGGGTMTPIFGHASDYFGQFTYGLGFYVGALKIMPAFKHSIELHTINKGFLKAGGLNHKLELSFGYFPFGKNLNLKIGYVYTGEKSVLAEKSLLGGVITHEAGDYDKSDDHKLITQVQMSI